jgi:septal ring factor EnvC (AmiA/AmiB activator)
VHVTAALLALLLAHPHSAAAGSTKDELDAARQQYESIQSRISEQKAQLAELQLKRTTLRPASQALKRNSTRSTRRSRRRAAPSPRREKGTRPYVLSAFSARRQMCE